VLIWQSVVADPRWLVAVVAVWLSGNALVLINVVTLHRARLVPGWVTVFGRVNYLDMQPATQVNLV